MTEPGARAGRWAGVVGRSGAGKHAALVAIVRALGERGVAVSGFLEEAVIREGRTLGYDAVDLVSGERFGVLRAGTGAGADICGYAMDGASVARLRERLHASAAPVRVLEVGKLEARGLCHAAAVNDALSRERGLTVLVLRPDIVAGYTLGLPDPVADLALPATATAIAAFAHHLARGQATGS